MNIRQVLDAVNCAVVAHGDQKRKYTSEPYIVHPIEVARLLQLMVPKCTTDMVCAAILHDTVEDTPLTFKCIEFRFNREVKNLVYWLTDVSKPSDGNREYRKTLDRKHIANAPPEAKTIKLCDLIDNTRTITHYDPGFVKIYMNEKRLLLPYLKEGDEQLWKVANGLVEDYYNRKR